MGEFWAPGAEIWLFKKKNMDRSIDLAVQHMVQFLFGSEIIFQITSRFGLAKLENEGGALKNKIWTDRLCN